MLDWLSTHWDDLLLLVTSIIGTASLIVKLTPTPKDDTILSAVKKFVSRWIALNP